MSQDRIVGGAMAEFLFVSDYFLKGKYTIVWGFFIWFGGTRLYII